MKVDKNLIAISWIAAFVSMFGVVLNSYKIIWCWPIWIVSNAIWIYYGVKTKQWSLVILWIVFTFANIFGYYQWYTNP